jgi:hypothetical protein
MHMPIMYCLRSSEDPFEGPFGRDRVVKTTPTDTRTTEVFKHSWKKESIQKVVEKAHNLGWRIQLLEEKVAK